MGLSRKTFLYSMILAVIMTAFVIGYFILMLPSLYVDYVMRDNLDSVLEIQQGYMEHRSYEDLTVRNPSAVFSVLIPKEGEEIYLEGKFFRLTARVLDEEVQEFLDLLREMAGQGGETVFLQTSGETDNGAEAGLGEMDLSRLQTLWNDSLKDKFMGQKFMADDYPVRIEVEGRTDSEAYQGEYTKVHFPAEDIVVFETGITDGDFGYITYFAYGQTGDAYVMTVMPTITPRMEEITPVVSSSLPMIIAVIFLVVLIASRFFSGRIVNPVIRLANYAESAGISGSFGEDAFEIDSRDEIGMLGRRLHELYRKLQDNYEELEEKNRILEEENERQEVFLRASSHQLKTPVAAALLLVEGMIHEVGKYKDTKAYLPEVKKQLLSMQRIVEDILYLNHCTQHMQIEEVDLRALIGELVTDYLVQVENRGVRIETEGSGTAAADREMLRIIVDNLLSNAVQYTPGQQRIAIRVEDHELSVTNYGVRIEEELLPNIFEPFVSSDTIQKGKGLGLYVASYYCRRMGCRLEIGNTENGVCASVLFPKEGQGESGQEEG